MHSVKLLILFTIWTISIAAVSFLVLPFKGEVLGLSIALVYLILIYVLLDKWVLLFLMGREAKRGDANLDALNNLSYSFGLRNLKLYYSRKRLGNIVTLDWRGQPILIVEDFYSQQKIEKRVLEDAIEQFSKKQVKRSSWLAYVMAMYNMPLVLLEKLFKRSNIFSLLFSVWTSPFFLLIDNYGHKNGVKLEPPYELRIGGDFDLFTTLSVKILGVYKTEERDLVSVIFSKEV